MIEILPNWHPIFVHFSVALLLTAAGLRIASHFVADARAEQLVTVARWNLWIGVALTLFTVASGVYAYNTVDHDTPSHLRMTTHRNWAIVTALVFVLVAVVDYVLHRKGQGRSGIVTGVLAGASALLLVTAWHGGELVYRHGLGVKSLPQAHGEGHAHEHPDGSDHSHGDAPAADGGADHHRDEFATEGQAKTEDHPHAPGTAPHAH